MAEDTQDLGMEPVSEKDMLMNDMNIVNTMTKWKRKLSKGEHIKVKALDKGMMPTINIGDIAEVVPVQTSSLKGGNVIFFRAGSSFMIRRIVEVVYTGRGEFKVKGDNMVEPDPPVPSGNILGKVIAIEHEGERIEMEKTLASTLNQLNKRFGGSDTAKMSIKVENGKKAISSFLGKKNLIKLSSFFYFVKNIYNKLQIFFIYLNNFNKKHILLIAVFIILC